MSIDFVVNLMFFIVGLAIGLLQLYVGQRQFQAQQQEKMDELRSALAEIKAGVAVLKELSSQRSFDLQDRLIELATAQKQVAQVAEETSAVVRELVAEELTRAGIPDSIGKSKALDTKIVEAVEKSASNLADILVVDPAQLTHSELEVLKMMLEGAKLDDIAKRLDKVPSTVRTLAYHAYKKLGVASKEELMAKYGLKTIVVQASGE